MLRTVFVTVLFGVGGFVYARFGAGALLWHAQLTAALAGAFFGFVAAFLPRQLGDFFRRRWLGFRIANIQAGILNLVAQAEGRAQKRLKDDPADADAHRDLGLARLLAGDADRAIVELEQASLHGSDASGAALHCNLGAALAQGHRYSDAARHLVEAVPAGGLPAEAAVLNLGLLYAHDGEEADALARGPIEQGDCALAHNNRGVYCLRQGDLEDGRVSLARALELRPSYSHAKSNLALADFHNGRRGRALDGAAAAATLTPDCAKSHVNLGTLLLIAGHLEAAGEALVRASLLAPKSCVARVALGAVHLEVGDNAGAVTLLQQATALDVESLAAWHNLALAHLRRGAFEDALRTQQRAAALGPERVSPHVNLGCCLWETGDLRAAAEEFRHALELQPDSVEAGRNLGLALIRSGRHREAAALLERLLDQNPTDTVLLFGLGAARFIAALEAYRPEMRPQDRQALYSEMYRAFRLFEAALTKEQAPSRELHHNIALYHYIRREFDPAEKRFLEALKLGEDAQTHFCVGVVRADYAVQLRKEHEAPVEELPPQARDKLRQALQSFEAAVVLAPESCDAVCNLGMAAYQLGEFETSVKAFRRLAHHERSAEAYNALALVHAKRAKWLQLQAKAVSLASEAKRTIMVREARKLLNVATNCFKEAVHRDNRNPILHSNIGLAYLFRNEGDDVQSALAHWQMMRRVGGAWGERQYAILSEMVEAKEHAKAEYNDTELAYRPIDPRGAVLSISPVPAGPIQVFDDCYDETDWQIVSDDPLLQKALARRLRLRALEARRQALSV